MKKYVLEFRVKDNLVGVGEGLALKVLEKTMELFSSILHLVGFEVIVAGVAEASDEEVIDESVR